MAPRSDSASTSRVSVVSSSWTTVHLTSMLVCDSQTSMGLDFWMVLVVFVMPRNVASVTSAPDAITAYKWQRCRKCRQGEGTTRTGVGPASSYRKERGLIGNNVPHFGSGRGGQGRGSPR